MASEISGFCSPIAGCGDILGGLLEGALAGEMRKLGLKDPLAAGPQE